MSLLPEFVAWAGSQAAAGQKLGIGEAMVSLILSGKRPLQPQQAINGERNSDGLFKADDLKPGVQFTRDEAGQVTGWLVEAA